MRPNEYKPHPLESRTVYHIFGHAVANNNLFECAANYTYFLKRWQHFAEGYFRTFAYCLMPNHFHLCVLTVEPSAIRIEQDMPKRRTTNTGVSSLHSARMEAFLSSYAQAFNKFHSRKGVLFRSAFGRIPVTHTDNFKNLICYIHHNPIHHFGADSYLDWAYSSYATYLFPFNEGESFIDTVPPLNRFQSLDNFKLFHELYKTKRAFLEIDKVVSDYYNQFHSSA
jgi:putative transposase